MRRRIKYYGPVVGKMEERILKQMRKAKREKEINEILEKSQKMTKEYISTIS